MQDVPQSQYGLTGGTGSVPATGTEELFHPGEVLRLVYVCFPTPLKLKLCRKVLSFPSDGRVTPNMTEPHPGLIGILFPKARINLEVSIVFPQQC